MTHHPYITKSDKQYWGRSDIIVIDDVKYRVVQCKNGHHTVERKIVPRNSRPHFRNLPIGSPKAQSIIDTTNMTTRRLSMD